MIAEHRVRDGETSRSGSPRRRNVVVIIIFLIRLQLEKKHRTVINIRFLDRTIVQRGRFHRVRARAEERTQREMRIIVGAGGRRGLINSDDFKRTFKEESGS